MLISFAVNVKLICAFGFAYADCWLDCWFSHEGAHKCSVLRANLFRFRPGLEVIKLFSCLTQLSIKIKLLINTEIVQIHVY